MSWEYSTGIYIGSLLVFILLCQGSVRYQRSRTQKTSHNIFLTKIFSSNSYQFSSASAAFFRNIQLPSRLCHLKRYIVYSSVLFSTCKKNRWVIIKFHMLLTLSKGALPSYNNLDHFSLGFSSCQNKICERFKVIYLRLASIWRENAQYERLYYSVGELSMSVFECRVTDIVLYKICSYINVTTSTM